MNATLTVSLSSPVTSATTISYRTVDGTATAASGDYVGVTSGSVVIPVGASSAQIVVKLNGDTLYEPNETFTVQITSAPGLNLADGFGMVTIVNDDAGISIGNATITEGDVNTSILNVPITLTNASAQTITVVATTVAGSAVAGSDFVMKTATLTFAPGTTTAAFAVSIVNDRIKESTETFTIVLSSPTGNGSIIAGTGTVTIFDNDGAMLAAALPPADGGAVTPLTAAVLAPVVDQAESLWRAALPSADFSAYKISIGNLSGSQLGWTDSNATTIDATAAGWGWSAMDPGTTRMDLLTVVLHEMGRALGLTTDDAGRFPVMAATLSAGVRLDLVTHATAAIAEQLGTDPNDDRTSRRRVDHEPARSFDREPPLGQEGSHRPQSSYSCTHHRRPREDEMTERLQPGGLIRLRSSLRSARRCVQRPCCSLRARVPAAARSVTARPIRPRPQVSHSPCRRAAATATSPRSPSTAPVDTRPS